MKKLSECNEIGQDIVEALGENATNDQLHRIENLLNSSVYDHEYRRRIERQLHLLDREEAAKIITDLLNNQATPDQGNLGNQKQTAKHIKSIAQ